MRCQALEVAVTAQPTYRLTAQPTYRLTAQPTYPNPIEKNQWRRRFASLVREGAKGSRLRESVGSRLAPDWEASSEDVLLAEQLGLDAAAIALRFRDYWIAVPDPKGRKADWSATWRNWCRKEAESRAAAGGLVTA